MLIRFRVVGQLDFANVQYLIVFNTSGNKVEPYPQAGLSGFLNYKFALVVGGTLKTSQPVLFQYYLAPGTSSGIHVLPITIPTQYYNYVPNSGGNPLGGGEFTITFDRRLLYAANPGGSPTTAAGGAPTPTAVATLTPVGATPNPVPTTVATLNPNVAPTTLPQHFWAINFITTDLGGYPLDSMGSFGPTDTTFAKGIVDTTTPFDIVDNKQPVGTGSASNPSAQLQGFEIINAP